MKTNKFLSLITNKTSKLTQAYGEFLHTEREDLKAFSFSPAGSPRFSQKENFSPIKREEGNSIAPSLLPDELEYPEFNEATSPLA